MSSTLVLIHGHGVDASVWDAVYQPFAAKHTVIRPDFSLLTQHNTIEAYAEYLHSLLEQSQVEEVILVGHSMGGYISLAFAERYPEKVKALVLFHSTALADDEAKKEQRQKALQSLLEYGSEAFIRNAIPNMVSDKFKQQHPEVIEGLVKKYSQLPPEALAAGIRAIAGRPDRTHILKNATFPVLLVAGREDKIVPFEKSEALFGLSERIRLVVLEGAGHLGMIESPAEVGGLDFTN